MKNSNTTKTAKPLRNLTPQAKPIQTLQELAKNLRSDCFYFVSPWSAGDAYRLSLMKPALEQKYKGKIIFIIKPNHEAVCEMFEGLEYIICESQSVDICGNTQCLMLDNVVSVPALGKIYSHFINYECTIYSNNQLDFDRLRLMLPPNAQRVLPTNLPKISENLKARLDKIAPLDKMILFCPEANSYPRLPFVIFKYELERLRKQGYSVIVNALKYKQEWARFFIDGVYDLDLSLKEAIALGLACVGVISVRAGFCDIIQPHCKNLKIYYTFFDNYILWDNQLWHTPFQQVYTHDVPIYKAFLQLKRKFYEFSLPLKLYNRYIVKGFLKRLRTPFTAYFNIYKKHKANETQNEIKQNIMRDFSRNFGLNETEFETFSEIQSELESSYEYQLGRLLEKACKAFWLGGFLAFPFAYLKLRKQKKKLTRLNEILG